MLKVPLGPSPNDPSMPLELQMEVMAPEGTNAHGYHMCMPGTLCVCTLTLAVVVQALVCGFQSFVGDMLEHHACRCGLWGHCHSALLTLARTPQQQHIITTSSPQTASMCVFAACSAVCVPSCHVDTWLPPQQQHVPLICCQARQLGIHR